jgi:hypothetical protein
MSSSNCDDGYCNTCYNSEEGTVVITILQLEKQRHREARLEKVEA